VSQVVKLTFGPIQENTYIIYDETSECIVIDPGCTNAKERDELIKTITGLGLKPMRLINTHCHVDHIPGNRLIADTYQIGLEIHPDEVPVLEDAPAFADMFQIEMSGEQPPVAAFIHDGDIVSFGHTSLKALATPGHSPGSLSFYNETEGYVISGDVLFYRSVGRYDLPGADGAVLFRSITTKLMTLPDDVRVYSGHGTDTTIGSERKHNGFLKREMFT
jgi:glyoxylase-like metal-dependent hydrolase (beta-lactamase superfamily II)